MTNTAEFAAWQNMIKRCYRNNDKSFHRYGGRGISVSAEWLESFENFYKDMGKRPNKTSLDRIDNNGNYCKENCRWADNYTQSRNRIQNLIHNGEYAIDAAVRLGINPSAISRRIHNLGWSIENAFKIKKYGRM